MIGVTQLQQDLSEITKKRRPKRESREEVPDLTGAHAAAEGHMGGEDPMPGGPAAEAAAKGVATEGPGQPVTAAEPAPPREYDRPYLAEDHASPSPQAEPPMAQPMPQWPAGVPIPVQLGGVAVAMPVAAQVAASYAMGSPSDR